jgi:hypothetical protein
MLIGHVRDRILYVMFLFFPRVKCNPPSQQRISLVSHVRAHTHHSLTPHVITACSSRLCRQLATQTAPADSSRIQLTPIQAATLHPLQTAPAAEACAWHAFQTSVYTQRLQTEMHRNGASYNPAQHWKGHPPYNHPMRLPFCKRTK